MKVVKVVAIETQNGGGEARRVAAGEWEIAVPEGDLRFFGTTREMERRVREFVDAEVTFSVGGEP